MKNLVLTQSTDPRNPLDGTPYLFYNHEIGKVWLFNGLEWVLEDGSWIMDLSWANDGNWRSF